MISAKDLEAVGNPTHPVLRLALLVTLALLGVAPRAYADACPPAAVLVGDRELVRAVRDELGARGITGGAPSCPAVRFWIERRGAMLVVGMDGPGGAPIERVVTEPATAATVIESWTSHDVTAPLLEVRAMPARPASELAAPAVVVAARPAARGIQLFVAEETSIASDATVWGGMQLGACVMLGPICASVRLHGGRVFSWPSRMAGFDRVGAELYGGLDVPFALGRNRLTFGFAAGYGSMFTRRVGDAEHTGIELGGPRAEAHAAFAVPLSSHFALDLTATGSLNQLTRTEANGGDLLDPTIVFPGEPRAFFRLAVGVRYGSL